MYSELTWAWRFLLTTTSLSNIDKLDLIVKRYLETRLENGMIRERNIFSLCVSLCFESPNWVCLDNWLLNITHLLFIVWNYITIYVFY